MKPHLPRLPALDGRARLPAVALLALLAWARLGGPPGGLTPRPAGAQQLGAGPAGGVVPVTISSAQPGNVFTLGQRVGLRIAVARRGGRLEYWVTNYEGRELLRREEEVTSGDRLEVALPLAETGWYQLRWRLRDEDGRDLNGSASLAVVPRLRRGGSPRLGLDTALAPLVDADQVSDAARLARLTGVGVVRDRLLWEALEPEPGDLRAAPKYDRVVQALGDAGLSVYQVLAQLPNWASSGPPGEPMRVHYPPRDYDRIYQFFQKAAARYRRQVDAWEIWNEPDLSFFVGRPEEYAAVQKAGYLGVKAGNSRATVLFGSMATTPGTWLLRVMENGVCGYFDRYNLHYYTPLPDLWLHMKAHQDLLARFDCGKPAWMTEMGATIDYGGGASAATDRPSASAREQAAYVWQALPMALAGGAEKAFYFLLPHLAEKPGKPWGLLNPDLTPRPAYVALAVLTEVLGDADPRGLLAFPGGGTGLLFDAGRQEVLIAWTGRRETITLESKKVTVVDLMGRRRVEESDRDGVSIELGPEPLALVGLPRRLPGSFRALRRPETSAREPRASRVWTSLTFQPEDQRPAFAEAMREKESLHHPESQPLRLVVEVHNYSDREARVWLALSVPPGWRVTPEDEVSVRVRPGRTEREDFTVRVRSGGTTAAQPVEVLARTSDGPLPPTVGYVTLTSGP